MSVSRSASRGHQGAVQRIALAAWLACAVPVLGEPSFVQNGTAGFVVSEIKYALADDAEKTGACPHGFSLNLAEIFALTPEGKRRQGEPDKDYEERLEQSWKQFLTAPNSQKTASTTATPTSRYHHIGVDGRSTSATPSGYASEWKGNPSTPN